MSKLIDTNKPESRNWLKQWRAVFVTRQALLSPVSAEATQLHGYILNKAKVPACTKCSFRDVQNRNARCPYHVVLRNELVSEHAFGLAKGIGALTLKNTKAENWVNSPWEIAKVFMPPAGYEDKATIEETDFNGIAAFIINCKRFQGKITGTVCEKAREAVNQIRHMPDISSTALTDQATTECIDNLYALLNELGLKTLPEAIQAQAELDVLKTSKDENVYYSICQKFYDEFQQKLTDIERKLHAHEIDTERAKELTHSESQQFQKNQEKMLRALEKISDDAKQEISRTKDDILLSIEEERKRVKEYITSLERTTIEKIEQSVLDGKREFKVHVEKEKRQATEDFKQYFTERKRKLQKDQTEIDAKRLRTERLRKTKLEFKTQLIEYYNESASQMTVRLDIDATIENIYENPKLTLKKIENGTTTETDIPEVSQLFSISDGLMAKKIIVEGEPGTGKTSLCKKIVHDWLKVNEKVEQEPIKSNLSKFKFVFYIILHHVKTESEIKAMIVEHILKKIDSDYANEHSLLGEILKSEYCLLLLDGLDEWRGKMPHLETSWRKCTLLITTRPYKLAELKVIPTQVGKHVKLDGVQNPENLVLKVIRKLEEFHKTNKDPESCIEDLKDKQLWHFSKNPVVLVHIVWLWQKSKLRENMSLSTLYREIIDERWCDMRDKKSQDKDPQALYEILSAIAFNKLVTEHEDESLVFNIDGIQLEKFTQYKDASLDSGILSASNVPGEHVPKYQFLHKTFQEYLAAVFLSKRGSALSASCEHVKRIYSKYRNESVFALSQLFLFLCSLNPDAATEFSKVLNELFTENCEKDGSAEEARTFQQMILRGYDEAERNGHIGAEFCLQHIVLEKGLTENHMSKLKLCLEDKRKSNLVSLRITEESDLTSALQYSGDPTVLDLEICKNLKFVALVEVSYEDINQLNLNGLLECIIQFSNYKAASKVMTSLQSSDLRRLKSLVLKNVCFDCKAMDIFSKLECVKNISLTWCKASQPKDSHLDLYHLRHLKQLTLLELDVTDVVNLQMLNLHTLEIEFRTQQRAPKLIATLIPKGDGSLTTVRVGTHATLSYLKLKNVHMPSEVFMRLVSMVIQLGHKANCTLSNCTVDEDIIQLQEEVGNQPALQVVAPQPTAYEICILFSSVTMSAVMFRRLVSVVTQSGHPVQFEVKECTIEEDIKQLQKEIGSLTVLQVVAPQPASPDYKTHIWLSNVTISAGMFWRLVSVVIQPGHSVYFTLDRCTIAEDIEQLEEEFGNQLLHKMVATQPASTDYKTCIRLFGIAMSAGMFRRLVSVVIQSEHSVECLVSECTLDEDIKQLHEEVGNKSALQVVTQQPASPDYKINIFLMNMTMSARMYMRLVSAVMQSGHSVDFEVNECTIHDDIKQLQEELENPTALQVVASQPASTDYKKDIKLKSVVLPAGVLGRLVSVVTNSGRLVDCEIEYCTIDPVEEVKKLQLEMEEQPAVHVNGFSRCERGWCITYKSNV